VNCGVNRVRFPYPVRVGSRIRWVVRLGEVSRIAGGLQVIQRFTIEIEGVDKPACMAESVVLLVA
jgi:acyl dehydratase